jgi:ABC-2 type transport system permease protein/lipopolysaccharide transport system permease protein
MSIAGQEKRIATSVDADAIAPASVSPACPAFVAAAPRESFFQFASRSIAELKCVKFALASFVVNNLRRRYRRSVLGFAWSMLNPLLTMGVMTVVFSLLFHRDPREFSIFLFTGLLPWIFVTDSITNGSQAIVNAEPFLKKVYIPKMFFPLVAVSQEAVNFVLSLTSLMTLGLVIGMHVTPTLLLVPFAIALLCIFNFSAALFLAITTVYFRDLTHIVKIVMGALFYLVPIVYPLEEIPQHYRALFLINPFYYFINLFRMTINEGLTPSATDWGIPLAIASTALLVALVTLQRQEKDLIYRL